MTNFNDSRAHRPTSKQLEIAYDRLFSSGHALPQLGSLALDNRLLPLNPSDNDFTPGRSMAWKIFLAPREPLASSASVRPAIPPVEELHKARREYTQLLLDKFRAPDGGYEEGFTVPGSSKPTKRVTLENLDMNNPLSLHDENPWTDWFESVELRRTILQDVERTFPEIDYYRDEKIQYQLKNILYLYSASHPSIGYRQGMHEILAPIYHAVDMDSISETGTDFADNPTIRDMCSRTWIAADAWYLFQLVMDGIARWYEWRETPAAIPQGPTQPYIAPIVLECNQIQSNLRMVDPLLWTHLESASLEPTIYGIRWLRLLFTREFSFSDSMILWDALFACDPTFDLAPYICVAMLLRIRNELIPSDYSGQLTALLRYPSTPHVDRVANAPHHATVLVKQALALRAARSAATGASIVYENHEFLNIPIQVPAAPPPPVRRRAGHESRGQSASAPDGATRSTLQHQPHPQQAGLPELIARSLLERGESLGINRNTLMSAVTELRRNLPDLSGIGRVPTGMNETAYSTFPLEKSSEERSPLPHKSRFEVENEVGRLQHNNRVLGTSLSWIVDTLLRDETQDPDTQRLKGKKREALESLSYVRDALLGNFDHLDEERLLGEEEYLARKIKAHTLAQQSQLVTPVLSAPPAVANHRSSGSWSRSHSDSSRGAMPSATPLASPTSAPSQWHSARSSFGQPANLPAATELPRKPPASSSSATPSFRRNAPALSPPQQRRTVHSDPLGVLP